MSRHPAFQNQPPAPGRPTATYRNVGFTSKCPAEARHPAFRPNVQRSKHTICLGHDHETGHQPCPTRHEFDGVKYPRQRRCGPCSLLQKKWRARMSNACGVDRDTEPTYRRCNTCADLPWRRDVMCPGCKKPYADPPPIERGSVIRSSMGATMTRNYG
jgi:hypothetical protein